MGLKDSIMEGSIYVGYWALAYFILLPIIILIPGTEYLQENTFLLGLLAMLFSVVMVKLNKRRQRKLGRQWAQ
jgi:tellurite resistance protein TehA-like permease